ncbi:MAG: 6,7-dimethyl-8-ribityllumazine synthase [Bacteroidetes bacterium]|nr:6,7-dimethyl-8-ribityllumazine synthase [Bacteroidota bacterium]
MSSAHQSLSKLPKNLPNAEPYQFGIVISEWNEEITGALLQGAMEALTLAGSKSENIIIKYVPGSFELTAGASLFTEQNFDAIICLGCVIQGETRHFDFICDAVANGITQLSIQYNKPVIFGVLTTNTMQQATDRAGGKYGNKGFEAGVTAIKMAHLFSAQ